jgi:hypothetical protein
MHLWNDLISRFSIEFFCILPSEYMWIFICMHGIFSVAYMLLFNYAINYKIIGINMLSLSF